MLKIAVLSESSFSGLQQCRRYPLLNYGLQLNIFACQLMETVKFEDLYI